MKCIYVILMALLLCACQAKEDQIPRDDQPGDGPQRHIKNMMNQVNNDLKIFAGDNTNFYFEIDGVVVEQEAFLNQDMYKLAHISHSTTEYEDNNYGDISRWFDITFSAYSSGYVEKYHFTPEHYQLSFDDAGLLRLSVNHTARGVLSAYGYDKATGNKMVEYHDINFSDRFIEAKKINYRNAEVMRLVLMIKDSIFIDDYSLPQILSHDH